MTVRVGVIGAGTIGQDHIRRLSRKLANVTVVGIADVDRARAQSIVETLPGARVYENGHDVIAAADIDGVLVATWGAAHEEYVLGAIEHGKPVFCEKPLAPTVDACQRILDAESARGRTFVQVGFMRRWDAAYLAMRGALVDGKIGAPLLVHCAHRGPSSPSNFTSDMLITDSAIHEIDLMRWLLDEEIVAATVRCPRRNPRGRPDLQDPQVVVLETGSGVLVDVEVFVNAEYGYDIRCEVVGERGTVALGESGTVVVSRAGERVGHIPGHWIERFADAYDREIQAWIDSIVTGEVIGPNAWDGYAATAVASAAVASLESSGARVPVHLPARPSLYGDA